METSPVYLEYWKRKRLLASPPVFPVVAWWPTERMSPVESLWWENLRSARSLLDVGAGDLRVRAKLLAAGFEGTYHTQDVGSEYSYTFRSLDELTERYEAILCLDVLEHLALEDGLALLVRLRALLAPGGILVVQTPNGRCIRNPLGTDMTHLHLYNLSDLWAYLSALELETKGWRVRFDEKRRSPWRRLRSWLSAFLIAKILGADYCDNILLIARQRDAVVS